MDLNLGIMKLEPLPPPQEDRNYEQWRDFVSCFSWKNIGLGNPRFLKKKGLELRVIKLLNFLRNYLWGEREWAHLSISTVVALRHPWKLGTIYMEWLLVKCSSITSASFRIQRSRIHTVDLVIILWGRGTLHPPPHKIFRGEWRPLHPWGVPLSPTQRSQ